MSLLIYLCRDPALFLILLTISTSSIQKDAQIFHFEDSHKTMHWFANSHSLLPWELHSLFSAPIASILPVCCPSLVLIYFIWKLNVIFPFLYDYCKVMGAGTLTADCCLKHWACWPRYLGTGNTCPHFCCHSSSRTTRNYQINLSHCVTLISLKRLDISKSV